jgi:aldose 1-epimerase
LRWRHERDKWPWRFDAEHEIRLSQSALELTLSIMNKDAQPMPAGLGHHAYFPLTRTTDLNVDVEARIETDDAGRD